MGESGRAGERVSGRADAGPMASPGVPSGASSTARPLTRSPASSVSAVAVLGAGSWGTSLAWLLGRKAPAVTLWCRDAVRAAEIQAARCNPRYLPGVTLPDTVRVLA